MAIEFTDATVKDIIASGEPVVIDFWATWCGPCMRLAPVIEELAAQYEGKVKIGKYNIEEENDLSTEYRIMSIPTILFFKNGEQIRDLRLAGSQTKATLEAQIEKLLAM
ncbi:MAG: thioredoxin [Bacteroidales bacterium]|nr:thioredoxin [Bacteroidales bacterium]MBD5242184.1 thioredoxin [Barnesiella sp.]MDE5822528.1 thioredoxin [Paramuribaculum sp.]